jgi:hypothetical protein
MPASSTEEKLYSSRGIGPRTVSASQRNYMKRQVSRIFLDFSSYHSRLSMQIQSSVTAIVHNGNAVLSIFSHASINSFPPAAWPVNFTASLASLEPSVRSVRVFVDLALGLPHRTPPRLLFLSSIGLFYSTQPSSHLVPHSISPRS